MDVSNYQNVKDEKLVAAAMDQRRLNAKASITNIIADMDKG
jgi:hypothetical protein